MSESEIFILMRSITTFPTQPLKIHILNIQSWIAIEYTTMNRLCIDDQEVSKHVKKWDSHFNENYNSFSNITTQDTPNWHGLWIIYVPYASFILSIFTIFPFINSIYYVIGLLIPCLYIIPPIFWNCLGGSLIKLKTCKFGLFIFKFIFQFWFHVYSSFHLSFEISLVGCWYNLKIVSLAYLYSKYNFQFQHVSRSILDVYPFSCFL